MKYANLISVLGLIVSSFFSYTYSFLGSSGPGYHPMLVNLVVLLSFFVSYVLSLAGAKTIPSRITGLLFTFLGLSVTSLFSILVLLERTTYPSVFGVSGAYIQFLFFLMLVYLWIKHK
jgi:bacteriorhodopsin